MFARSLALSLLLASFASAQAPPATVPQPPTGFRLPPVQQQYLDQVLNAWEQHSGQIQVFSCDFTVFDYDPVFGPGVNPETGQQRHKTVGEGSVSYQQPDKGSFQVKTLRGWDAQKQDYVENPNLIGPHWVCDGKSVFQYVHSEKQLRETLIPPELQGKNIADGPLPFLFGAEAEKLKKRYWLRVDPRATEGTIWIVARPKTRADAANYLEVDIMLDAKRFLPYAMRVTSPDKSRKAYAFDLETVKINPGGLSALWSQLFSAPRTPFGWKRVVEKPQTAAAGAAERR